MWVKKIFNEYQKYSHLNKHTFLQVNYLLILNKYYLNDTIYTYVEYIVNNINN